MKIPSNAVPAGVAVRARTSVITACALSVAIGFSLAAAQSIASDQQAATSRGSDDALVAHVLNRVAFGPRPGDVERVRRIGVDAFIDEQLQPERITVSPAYQARLDALDAQRLPAGTLIDGYRTAQRDARAAQRAQALQAGAAAGDKPIVDGLSEQKADVLAARRQEYRRLSQQAYEARLIQAIDSPRQLQEVMTDFWYNHFNVFVGKDLDRALVSNYERDAIRRTRSVTSATCSVRPPSIRRCCSIWTTGCRPARMPTSIATRSRSPGSTRTTRAS